MDGHRAVPAHPGDHLRAARRSTTGCAASPRPAPGRSSPPCRRGPGIVGRVYASGEPAVVPDVTADPDYLPVRPDVTAELCVPVLDPAGRPIGVLDLQWSEPVDLEPWRETARAAGRPARRADRRARRPAGGEPQREAAPARRRAHLRPDRGGADGRRGPRRPGRLHPLRRRAGPRPAGAAHARRRPPAPRASWRPGSAPSWPRPARPPLDRMVDRAHRYGAGVHAGRGRAPARPRTTCR